MNSIDQVDVERQSAGLPKVTVAERKPLFSEVLRGVSRSFYLSIRVLPKELREPVGLAYLLARAADTIADTSMLPPDGRLPGLLDFRALIEGPADADAVLEFAHNLTDTRTSAAERVLVKSLPACFSVLEELKEGDGDLVRSVVTTLTLGMEMDLTTFLPLPNLPPRGEGTGQQLLALETIDTLDCYVYYVAGCVGEFWTQVLMAHTATLRHWDGNEMNALGIRFGKALQMTNVVRDVGGDLRKGRCYLPEDLLSEAGLSPEELMAPDASARARPVLLSLLATTLGHYEAAAQYIQAIPRRCVRLRLAALWPALIGLATLAKLARNERWLDPAASSKVTRRWVYGMMAVSLPCAVSNSILSVVWDRMREKVREVQ